MKKTLLWLDDFRNPFTNDWVLRFSPIGEDVIIIWVKTYKDFTSWITTNGLPDAICFDNDLGDFSTINGELIEKTGYDCAKWIVEYCLDNDKEAPLFNIQSDNTPAIENIFKLLTNFKNRTK